MSKLAGKFKNRASNLFFVEIIIVLLFFCISGTIVMRTFAAAQLQAQKSSIQENIDLCAQSLAEAFSQYGSMEEAASVVFGKDFEADQAGSCEIYIDQNCQITASSEEYIKLILSQSNTETNAGSLNELTMYFSYKGEELFRLTCSAYLPSEM